MDDLEIRFWGKAQVGGPDECWPWIASSKGKGYGQFWHDGKSVRAHRMAWELSRGKIPDDMNVLHDCDNRPCVNPAHLFLGTTADNNIDMSAKGRHGSHKLTRAQATEILASPLTHASLAEQFGVSKSMIGHIKAGRSWLRARIGP
jgi:hypothetical protein